MKNYKIAIFYKYNKSHTSIIKAETLNEAVEKALKGVDENMLRFILIIDIKGEK